MPKFLVTAKLLVSSTVELSFKQGEFVDNSKSEYVYDNFEIIAEDAKEAQSFAYKEYYFKYCQIAGETISNPIRIWLEAETIKLYSGKGAGKGGKREGAGRKKGSGSKYSEPTKAMKAPIRFDGKLNQIIEMADDLKRFINNWDEGLQPQPEGHYSARKELARKMLDDLKAVCKVLDEIAPADED